MAAEWGGISLTVLLDHGLLERRKEIGSISAEATASAVLRKTLEVGLLSFQYPMTNKNACEQRYRCAPPVQSNFLNTFCL